MESLRDLGTNVAAIWNQLTQPSTPAVSQSPAAVAAPAPAPAMSVPAQVKEPWVPAPDRFDGDSGMCRSFLLQCDLVFRQQPLSYATEDSRIAYLVGLLHGKALSWATAVWEQQSPITTSYIAFTAEMKRVFDHPVRGKDASKRLLSLRQGMRSVAEYSIEFRTLSVESGWNSEALQAAFCNGLNDTLKDELISYPEPSDLEGFITLAILRERKRER